MAVKTASFTRDPKSGSWKARRAIPDALRDAYATEYGARHEVKASWPSALNERQARSVVAEWQADIEARFQRLRDKAAGRGTNLSHRERFALIGEWHEWFAGQHGPDPGKPEDWEGYADSHFDAMDSIARRFTVGDNAEDLEAFDWTGHPQAREFMLAQIASAARADAFLADRNVLLTPESRDAFLVALEPELRQALERLRRISEGDYSATVRPERFPKRTAISGLPIMGLFDAYVRATKPARNTVLRWRNIFEQLDRFFPGRDVGSLTEQDAFDWRESLRASVSERSIDEGYVVAAKAVFNWAVANRKLASNPFGSLKKSRSAKRATKLRERNFRDAELTTIFNATTESPAPRMKRFQAAARRWVPWLLAYEGARPGEICQLRKEDVFQVKKQWALRLTPEAGSIKDNEARTIPLHEHLIEQGFIEFVESAPAGPLFYNPELAVGKDEDPTKPRRHPSEKTRMELGEWIRRIGVNDPNVRPLHAFRNTWKNRALAAGIDKVVRDFVQGHAPETVGDAYTQLEGEHGFGILVRELGKFPRYEFAYV